MLLLHCVFIIAIETFGHVKRDRFVILGLGKTAKVFTANGLITEFHNLFLLFSPSYNRRGDGNLAARTENVSFFSLNCVARSETI